MGCEQTTWTKKTTFGVMLDLYSQSTAHTSYCTNTTFCTRQS